MARVPTSCLLQTDTESELDVRSFVGREKAVYWRNFFTRRGWELQKNDWALQLARQFVARTTCDTIVPRVRRARGLQELLGRRRLSSDQQSELRGPQRLCWLWRGTLYCRARRWLVAWRLLRCQSGIEAHRLRRTIVRRSYPSETRRGSDQFRPFQGPRGLGTLGTYLL